jgi:hypothetical protein
LGPRFTKIKKEVSNEAQDKALVMCRYHGDTAGQTYSPMDFDTTGVFGPDIFDTDIAGHEIDEWQDDPTGGNPVPPWGHVGQQTGCQTNLEVGDPLTGTSIPLVTMPNGYSITCRNWRSSRGSMAGFRWG